MDNGVHLAHSTKNLLGSLVLVVGLFTLACLAGCSGADRPDASEGVGLQPVDEPSAGLSHGAGCEPRETRECHMVYYDVDGNKQCPLDIEICALDGATWLPCGQYVFDENHDPQPRTASH